MAQYLRLRSDADDSDGVVLVSGDTNTGYTWLSEGSTAAVLGSPVFEPIMVSSIDHAPTKVGETPRSRTVRLSIGVHAASVEDYWEQHQALLAELWSINQHGGRLRYRSAQSSHSVEFVIEHADAPELHCHEVEAGLFYQKIPVTLVCQPFAYGDCMDIYDPFTTNTLSTGGVYNDDGADWTAVAGSCTWNASGYVQAAAGAGTCSLQHTGAGYTHADAQVTTEWQWSAITNTPASGAYLKYVDANNYILAYIDDNGTNSRLRVDVCVGGSLNNRASTNLGTRIAADTTFWVRGRIEHGLVYAEHFAGAKGPQSMSIPGSDTTTVTTGYQLTTAEMAAVGPSVEGTCLLYLKATSTAAIRCYSYDLRPWTYVGSSSNGTTFYPASIPTAGSVPGDVPAEVDLHIQGTGSHTARSMMAAWMPSAGVYNSINNAGFEQSITSYTNWVATAVTGVNGAGTSILPSSAHAYEGSFSGELITPATSGTGASCRLFAAPNGGRWLKGHDYTFELYARSSAQVTQMVAKLGNGTHIASGNATALSTTWTKHTVTWTPDADYDVAYMAFVSNAATATTCQLDRCQVYEGRTAPATNDLTAGAGSTVFGGVRPFGVIDASNMLRPSGTWTETADGGNTRGGTRMSTASTSARLAFIADPSKITADDRSGVCLVDVWARVHLPTGLAAAATLTVSVQRLNNFTNEIYTQQYGPTGRSLAAAAPSSGSQYRPVFLGTLALPVPSDEDGLIEAYINLGLTNAAAATIGIDFVALVPAARSAISMPGTTLAASTEWLPYNKALRIVRSDGSGQAAHRGGNDLPGLAPAPGLVGAQLLVDPGVTEWFLWPSDYLWERTDASTDTFDDVRVVFAHMAVRPRYFLGRGA